MSGRPRKHCPEHLIPHLGTRTLEDLAQEAGVSTATVNRWRREHNVRTDLRNKRKEDLRAKYPGLEEAMNDPSLTLRAVGERFGISRERVRQIRQRWGYAPTSERRSVRRKAVEDQCMDLLGTMPDAAVARRIGETSQYVSYVRNANGIAPYTFDALEGFEHLLGTMSDGAVARASGASIPTVEGRRKKLGIEAHRRRIDRERFRGLFEEGLSDDEIAEAMDMSRSHVSVLRHHLNLLRGPRRPTRRGLGESPRGRTAYNLRATGLSWGDVAEAMGLSSDRSAFQTARKYAVNRGIEWPLEVR